MCRSCGGSGLSNMPGTPCQTCSGNGYTCWEQVPCHRRPELDRGERKETGLDEWLEGIGPQ